MCQNHFCLASDLHFQLKYLWVTLSLSVFVFWFGKPRINWIMQLVVQRRHEVIGAQRSDGMIIGETSVGDQFGKRVAISHRDGWDYIFKIG